MNVEERRLIEGLFSRMRDMRGIDKDREAADLIAREAEANPDAVYLLTQSVLVQEHALQKANARIEELEAAASGAGQGSADRSSGFLPRSPAAATSTPQVGRVSGLRSGLAGAGASTPSVRRQDGEGARAGAGRSGGGSFMGQAMSTAAGVAGGMLLASGISSLFSDGSAAAGDAGSAGDAAAAAGTEPGADAAAGSQTAGADQAATDPGADAGLQEAGMDGGDEGWFDFGDFGDFDL